jgi:hypothetical protein
VLSGLKLVINVDLRIIITYDIINISVGERMKNISKLIIREMNIQRIDMMGYYLKKEDVSYHHLMIPNRENGPMTIWNGAILNRSTSHPYLHLIESKDYEIFMRITSEMIDEKIKNRIDIENLKYINDLLCYFEKEFSNMKSKKGKLLIKNDYKERFLKK